MAIFLTLLAFCMQDMFVLTLNSEVSYFSCYKGGIPRSVVTNILDGTS